MAFINKYSTTAAVKTHGLVDGSPVDIFMPGSPLDSTGELARMGVAGILGWVGHNYKTTGSFGL